MVGRSNAGSATVFLGCTVQWFRDLDGDGAGDPSDTLSGCEMPSGYVNDDTDCDDADPTVHGGALEACDGVDNDCDGIIDLSEDLRIFYEDLDGDGFPAVSSSMEACRPPNGYMASPGEFDCDDTDPSVHPGAREVPDDGVDNNCSGRDRSQGGACGCSYASPVAPWPLLMLIVGLRARRQPGPRRR